MRINLGLLPSEFQIAARVGFLAFAVFGFTACASVSSFSRSADSLLPIETVDASSGRIVSARAFETSDRLYVEGKMQKLFGYSIPPAAHVDIQLINGDRGIIAEKQDSIREVSPREQNAGNRLYSYVASFPLEIARQATGIRVSYSPFSHKDHLDPSARASAGIDLCALASMSDKEYGRAQLHS